VAVEYQTFEKEQGQFFFSVLFTQFFFIDVTLCNSLDILLRKVKLIVIAQDYYKANCGK